MIPGEMLKYRNGLLLIVSRLTALPGRLMTGGADITRSGHCQSNSDWYDVCASCVSSRAPEL
jgi:hypothetical protein